jgi:NAD-dependent SIR2 family protein deacetylase
MKGEIDEGDVEAPIRKRRTTDGNPTSSAENETDNSCETFATRSHRGVTRSSVNSDTDESDLRSRIDAPLSEPVCRRYNTRGAALSRCQNRDGSDGGRSISGRGLCFGHPKQTDRRDEVLSSEEFEGTALQMSLAFLADVADTQTRTRSPTATCDASSTNSEDVIVMCKPTNVITDETHHPTTSHEGPEACTTTENACKTLIERLSSTEEEATFASSAQERKQSVSTLHPSETTSNAHDPSCKVTEGLLSDVQVITTQQERPVIRTHPLENWLAYDQQIVYDEPDTVVMLHAQQVVEWIRSSNHVVVQTEYEILTTHRQCIPDNNLQRHSATSLWDQMRDFSPTHCAVSTLVRKGIVKHVITTNCDNLHQRNGISDAMITELNGNIFQEVCANCGARSTSEPSSEPVSVARNADSDHRTRRKCPLYENGDTIILDTETDNYAKADVQSELADLLLVLGSPMSSPLSIRFPLKTLRHRGRVIVCNNRLRSECIDNVDVLIVYSQPDKFMTFVMKVLDIEIEQSSSWDADS